MENINDSDLDLSAMFDYFIAELDPQILRRVLAVTQYEHKCSGALHNCCGMKLCNTCYTQHLRQKHGEHPAMFWHKLAVQSQLTWPAKRAVVDKSTKPHRVVVKPKPRKARKLRIDELSVDQAVDLLELIQLQLGK